MADLTSDWKTGRSVSEGRIDEGDDAVSLVTIHSAKGLEWPVVIPINTGTQLRGPEQFVHRQSDDALHWVLGGLTPPHLADAQAEETRSAARERERLWYVACTRARDLLILPELSGAGAMSWAKILDLGVGRLPDLDLKSFPALAEDEALVMARAQALGAELRALEGEGAVHPDPEECAATALKAPALPDVSALWPTLQAEVPLYATDDDGALVAGRADAVALKDGRIEVVVDWKTDLDPSSAERADYVRQVAAYLRITGAARGALVYLSRGEVVWIHAAS